MPTKLVFVYDNAPVPEEYRNSAECEIVAIPHDEKWEWQSTMLLEIAALKPRMLVFVSRETPSNGQKDSPFLRAKWLRDVGTNFHSVLYRGALEWKTLEPRFSFLFLRDDGKSERLYEED